MEFVGLLWSEVVIRPMTNSLLLLYVAFFSNMGLAIIAFTIIMRVVTFPLALRQAKQTKAMSQMQPKMKEIQKKHAGDKQKVSQEMMKMYRQQGVSPLGCLGPMLIQFPIWIGLFYVVRNTLPTTPESLASLGPHLYSQLPVVHYAIPVNGSFLWLNLGLPDPTPVMALLVGASTWVMQRMSTVPSADPAQRSQSTMMQIMMPLLLMFVTLGFASGLAVYWIVSNLVGIVIQYFVTGWGGMWPSRQPATTTDALPPEKEKSSNGGDERESRDIRQDSGGGHRDSPKATGRRSRRGRGKGT